MIFTDKEAIFQGYKEKKYTLEEVEKLFSEDGGPSLVIQLCKAIRELQKEIEQLKVNIK